MNKEDVVRVYMCIYGFPGDAGDASAGDVRDSGSTPGLGRSPGGEHGSPRQCSCLENRTDSGAWWAAVPGSQSWTGLSN